MRKWLLFFLGTAWIFGITTEGMTYKIDYDFLYKEESVYESSKFTLDLSYNRNANTLSNNGEENGGTTLDSKAKLKTSIGAIRKAEKPIYGYWFDTAFEYTYESYKETSDYGTYGDTDRDENINKFEIREFEDVYEGFLIWNYGDVGIKRYFSEQSPYYYFGQNLFYWEKIESENDESDSSYESQNNNPEILAGGGVGYGTIVNLGSYERVLIVQDELLKAGILKNKFSRSTILRLLPYFRKKRNEYDRLSEVQSILEEEGLIKKGQLTLDIATDLIDAIDESFEKREYGFEARAGYLQELVHKDPDQEKVGRIYAYAQYEKPLSNRHQYTIRSDFFHTFFYGSEEENVISGTELLVKNYISSVWSSNWESRAGVDLISKNNLSNYYIEQMQMRSRETLESGLISNYYYNFYYPEGISTKLYGQLEYEITDTLTWENGVSYIYVKPYNSNYDTEEYFEVISTLSYEIW